MSGVRTPQSIDALKNQMPEVYEELENLSRDLENHFHDMQDVEFTVESGKLFMLQTRSGKRSGEAAVKIAVDMVEDGLLTQNEALLRITPDDIRALLHNRIQFPERHQPIARGLNAAPGAVSGRVVFDPLEAVSVAKASGGVILVRPETSPDDIQGIAAAGGVLTSRGGLTSHAAIVTRAMGKPCVCGAEEVTVDLEDESFKVGRRCRAEGGCHNRGRVQRQRLPRRSWPFWKPRLPPSLPSSSAGPTTPSRSESGATPTPLKASRWPRSTAPRALASAAPSASSPASSASTP